MSKLPLKVRVGFRDLWECPSAPAQRAITTLKELVGYQIDVDIDIALLWSELQKYYPDPEDFALNITSIVRTWAECLTARLQDDGNVAWTEKLLEAVTEKGTILKARLESRSLHQVRTIWLAEVGRFIIYIPEASPPYEDHPSSTIASDLEKVFEEGASFAGPVSKTEDNEWATVNLPSRSKHDPSLMTSTKLPAINSLSKPETLFTSQIPYHMILHVIHNGVSIQGSHQPSLQLISDYFQKFTKADKNDVNKASLLKIEPQQSMFGYGNLTDSLVITPRSHRAQWDPVNPVLFLSFIESILGYRNIPELSSFGYWQFKRDVPFA